MPFLAKSQVTDEMKRSVWLNAAEYGFRVSQSFLQWGLGPFLAILILRNLPLPADKEIHYDFPLVLRQLFYLLPIGFICVPISYLLAKRFWPQKYQYLMVLIGSLLMIIASFMLMVKLHQLTDKTYVLDAVWIFPWCLIGIGSGLINAQRTLHQRRTILSLLPLSLGLLCIVLTILVNQSNADLHFFAKAWLISVILQLICLPWVYLAWKKNTPSTHQTIVDPSRFRHTLAKCIGGAGILTGLIWLLYSPLYASYYLGLSLETSYLSILPALFAFMVIFWIMQFILHKWVWSRRLRGVGYCALGIILLLQLPLFSLLTHEPSTSAYAVYVAVYAVLLSFYASFFLYLFAEHLNSSLILEHILVGITPLAIFYLISATHILISPVMFWIVIAILMFLLGSGKILMREASTP